MFFIHEFSTYNRTDPPADEVHLTMLWSDLPNGAITVGSLYNSFKLVKLRSGQSLRF